ncbi:hypothetical protein I302_102307 [Kwoniella bestiolae CBS 10118]|uniref:Uncharacterized protein n=1 Tax=Kwoniella bestiolae CBS 10118 TaxID=1296100 RepID=A0A1B9GEL0_9TREE|nr:hypothetical protein I302_00999 [Kwoniella bestiolae CBS 10118]OCF29493.1 hypothetical protein I302_00999 [Kwoniella bestiolae CBS 10118]
MSFASTSSSPTPTPTPTTSSSYEGISWMTFTGETTTIVDFIDSSGNFYVPSSSSGVGSTRRTLSSTSTGQSGSYGQFGPSPTPSGVVTSRYGGVSSSVSPSSTFVGNGNNSTGSEQSSNTGTGTNSTTGQLSLVHVIMISVFATLVLIGCVVGCCLCRRRRRRRRERNMRIGGNESKMDISDIPSPLSANTTYPPRISHRDLDNILIHPSSSFSPITPIPNSATPFINRPSSRRTQTDSLYTDNSEFDMLAQDGSSYARTLSTYSEGINSEYSERDLGGGGTYVSLNSGGNGVGRSLVGRPRLEVDTKSPEGPSTVASTSGWNGGTLSTSYDGTTTPTLSNPHTYTSTNTTTNLISPFSDPSYAQPPISPISMTSTNRSWRTEDEVLLMARPSQSRSTRTTSHPPNSTGLGRSTTIIRHTDGGAVNPFRSDDDEAREREREMGGHLPPPSYGELYPQDR